MEAVTDTYRTINGNAESQFTEQRSRFISFAFPVRDADEVKERVSAIQKEYYDARHVCYAYMLGPERQVWRANDNGEPSGTAGKPILGQINSNELTDILIAVVRYFGGVKLGTSGLIEAYRRAAADVIQASEIVERYVEKEITVVFSYPMMNDLMRLIKDMGLTVVSQDYGQFVCDSQPGRVFDCKSVLRTRLSNAEPVLERIGKLAETQRTPEIIIA